MLSINHQTVSLASKGIQALLLSTALAVITAHSAVAKNSDTPIHFAKRCYY